MQEGHWNPHENECFHLHLLVRLKPPNPVKSLVGVVVGVGQVEILQGEAHTHSLADLLLFQLLKEEMCLKQ